MQGQDVVLDVQNIVQLEKLVKDMRTELNLMRGKKLRTTYNCLPGYKELAHALQFENDQLGQFRKERKLYLDKKGSKMPMA